ncbi:cell division protein FtsZ [Paenibacillus oralis]|uniref:Cell division protein FtsZ n=1 Tax=Paenibacillus oralis TaxID=2490856 RepID=A0A3P3TCR8_9BACL|nr:cell division protein FtsZ [Paenibacillus oralis]RRJ54898.1 cell division protein FtsZ [Paenibacillus oralis]
MGLSNSKVLSFMNENALIKDVSLRFGVIGAGQKGNKDADIFAAYTYADGKQIYPSLAINFSKTDMIHLKHIDEEDRIHFDGFKGAARTPSLVIEAFDPEVNENANKYRQQLIDAMERKFSEVDHLFICAGAGGGFGTGFVSLALGLIKEQFFPVPVTLLVSIPIDDPTEMTNAILLMSEINEFIKLQEDHFDPGDVKPLGSVIITDNKKLFNDFSGKKENRKNNDILISWKDEGNDVIISTIHEANVIPANFGSDNVTYDPSDFVRLMQVTGGFLSIHKASLEAPFDADDLKNKMKNSIQRGYFACGHNYDTAQMYGGFVLRPSSASIFKDVKMEQTIRKTILESTPAAQGKYGDPIWNEAYAVVYTMFSGMIMPNRVVEMSREYDEIKERQKQIKSKEVNVDISGAMESVKQSTFNPYQRRTENKFGSRSAGVGGGSVFSRKQEQGAEQESVAALQTPAQEAPKKKFGGSSTEPGTSNPWANWNKNSKNK